MAALLVLSYFCLLDLQVAAEGDNKATTVKTSNIIPSAGEAKLANGNGDVSPSGLK